MAGSFVHTLGDASQLPKLLNGIHLQGRSETRLVMVGRSNVGKSSLINALMGGRLARVSKEPGKTRAIHFYFWQEARKVVADLPGYGYARVSFDERDRWAKFINAYLDADPHIEQALVLLDSRHGPTDLDREAIGFLSLQGIPVTFVLTKFDTLKTQSERARRKKEVSTSLSELGYAEAPVFWVSSESRQGISELKRELCRSESQSSAKPLEEDE